MGVVAACVGMALATLAAGSAASFGDALEDGCPGGQSAPIFSEVGTTEEEARGFLAALQAAAAAGDKKRVVSMIRYPIAAWAEGRDVTFKSPESLLASYDRVFTARLKKTIAEARLECLFTNSQGIMVHDGEIWFRPIGVRGLKIVKINAPLG